MILSETEDVRLDGFEKLFAKTLPADLESKQLQQVECVRSFFFNLDQASFKAFGVIAKGRLLSFKILMAFEVKGIFLSAPFLVRGISRILFFK